MRQFQNKKTGDIIFVDDTDKELLKKYEDNKEFEEYFALVE
jgi:hypothetical protein